MITTSSAAGNDRLSRYGADQLHQPTLTQGGPKNGVRSWGAIGYRSVGQGHPLLLLQGSGSSIDLWPPRFLDALARHHRVLTPDNEGIGLTTLRPGILTVTRMADDTESFITALHLKRPDVLGQSMGGFIAQALAVRHPSTIRRLILCATAPGNGRDIPGHGPGALGLFPRDQHPAFAAYLKDTLRYPGFYNGSPAIAALQAASDRRWLAGLDPAGHRINRLHLPTLIGDGAEDPLTPPANSRILAATIPHAVLKIYPDAAHAFAFQDVSNWTQRVEDFLH
jgi:pimeloyl-ACP methyl ester carboxylesterase